MRTVWWPIVLAVSTPVLLLSIATRHLVAQEQPPLEDTEAFVTTISALRNAPSDTAAALTLVLAGTTVRVRACASGWCNTAIGGVSGYVRRELLTTERPVPSPSVHSRITREYHRIDNYTDTQLAEMMDVATFKLGAFYTCPGQGACVPAFVTLHIASTSSDWQYLVSSHLRLLLGGKVRIDLGELTHEGTVGSGYVLEQFFARVPLRTFQRIVRATEVEGQLGRTEFSLTTEQLAVLRELAGTIRSRPTR